VPKAKSDVASIVQARNKLSAEDSVGRARALARMKPTRDRTHHVKERPGGANRRNESE